ncbi:MAG: methionyl-tRNA formyltransferase [Woeseiaceae bacterium]|nr:methionyl-tRNA formyltransferase [Woeseiaceae bacterium]
MNRPRVLFAGTPEFARASLSALIDAGHTPVAVLTQPDRPSGRGKKIVPSPVKALALEHDIPVLQPGTLKTPEAVAELEALKPDVLIVAAYGLILPQSVLDVPTHGCLNVHGSILPRWRGAAPIQAAILAGDDQTGISLMGMTAGLDCGPVYSIEAVKIGDHETAGELHDRLATLGGELLMRDLEKILSGELTAVEQDDDMATYAGKIKTADARLDWSEDAEDLVRKVRAFNPVPGAWFMLDKERIKVWEADFHSLGGEPGEVIGADDDAIVVAAGTGGLRLKSLQRPGRGRVSAREFNDQLDLHGKTLG